MVKEQNSDLPLTAGIPIRGRLSELENEAERTSQMLHLQHLKSSHYIYFPCYCPKKKSLGSRLFVDMIFLKYTVLLLEKVVGCKLMTLLLLHPK